MKHSVSHFIIFGCVAYSWVLVELRRKLDDKSETCIFIGHSEDSKAYRLYNPISKKMITSRDLIFKEKEAWDENMDKVIRSGAQYLMKMSMKRKLDSQIKKDQVLHKGIMCKVKHQFMRISTLLL